MFIPILDPYLQIRRCTKIVIYIGDDDNKRKVTMKKVTTKKCRVIYERKQQKILRDCNKTW